MPVGFMSPPSVMVQATSVSSFVRNVHDKHMNS